MALNRQSRALRINATSEAFPAGVLADGEVELNVSWDEILWAALTIGRPSVHHVMRHGAASLYEAIFRISLVRMALEQHSPASSRIRRSETFKSLDPTEKGAVSYFLGMVFCKVFSSRLLQTPWLLHLDVFRDRYSASSFGRSRPDLFGQQSRTGHWHAFETKGRASKPSASDRARAKMQASRLLSVGGSACVLHVGTFTFFVNDVLRFHWIDPPSEEKRKIELPEIGDGWRFYYGPILDLWKSRALVSSEDSDGTVRLSIEELDIDIYIHSTIVPFLVFQVWEQVQSFAFQQQQALAVDGFRDDGLRIVCGPSWRERVSENQETE